MSLKNARQARVQQGGGIGSRNERNRQRQARNDIESTILNLGTSSITKLSGNSQSAIIDFGDVVGELYKQHVLGLGNTKRFLTEAVPSLSVASVETYFVRQRKILAEIHQLHSGLARLEGDVKGLTSAPETVLVIGEPEDSRTTTPVPVRMRVFEILAHEEYEDLRDLLSVEPRKTMRALYEYTAAAGGLENPRAALAWKVAMKWCRERDDEKGLEEICVALAHHEESPVWRSFRRQCAGLVAGAAVVVTLGSAAAYGCVLKAFEAYEARAAVKRYWNKIGTDSTPKE